MFWFLKTESERTESEQNFGFPHIPIVYVVCVVVSETEMEMRCGVVSAIITDDRRRSFLVDLGDWISHELSQVDARHPQQRYAVYKQVFSKVTSHSSSTVQQSFDTLLGHFSFCISLSLAETKDSNQTAHDNGSRDWTYHAHHFIFSFTLNFNFLFIPCGRLCWLYTRQLFTAR